MRAGSNHRTDPSDNVQTASVVEIFLPDDYFYNGDTDLHTNDIALLRLADPGFEFNAHVRPICLPEPSSTASGCYTAGWGGIQYAPEVLPDMLQQGAMLDITTDRCNNKLDEISAPPLVDAESMRCAGYLDGTISVCLVCDFTYNTYSLCDGFHLDLSDDI